ncbi:MAG: hypothetical protein FD138_2322 [Planctomycetota bacterium]|nr:MAG: hypothetical protein FD138_2322 [Planctomycetota bacterium]
MSHTQQVPLVQPKYHPAAREFVDHALRLTQKKFVKSPDDAHVSGRQLLEGIRELAIKEFGMMTIPVFRHWGVTTTEDFGRIVWELVERGDMRRTERDQLSDFSSVYDFDEVFDRGYEIDTSTAFRR